MRRFLSLAIFLGLYTVLPADAQLPISYPTIEQPTSHPYQQSLHNNGIGLLTSAVPTTELPPLHLLPDDPSTRTNCSIYLKKKRESRIILISAASAGLVLMVTGVFDAVSHVSIYGGGGGSTYADAAVPCGTLLFVGAWAMYAVEIPRLNKKYRDCMRH